MAGAGTDRGPSKVHHHFRRHWPIWAFVLVAALIVLLARAAAGEEAGARGKIMSAGKEDFAESCASCHGADATGTGELATKLVKPPKDLTGTAGQNGGQFPFWNIFDVIAGEAKVPGHDTHQMPEFYARLKQDDFKPGYAPSHFRVLALTHYLESLQK